MMKPLILVVEDEDTIANFIRVSLESQEFRCLVVGTGAQALSMAASHRPDVLVLDLGLPDMDGLTVIEKLREWTKTPVVVVSARGHEREKVEALDRGADDYLTKPFGIAELLARVRVALRHQKSADAPVETAEFSYRGLHIDSDAMRVKIDGRDVHLTPTEYSILLLMAKYQGKVLTHKFIVKEIWGQSLTGDVQKLRVTMGNLRRKIEKKPAEPCYLLTEVGVGYRFADE